MSRTVTVAFLGDINGAPGKACVERLLPALRDRWQPQVVIANAENARNGSGLTPELYRGFRAMGIDAVNWGPGSKSQAHQQGEWLHVREVLRSAAILDGWLFGS